MTNKFGNYVVKKLYDVNDSNNQKRMFKYISKDRIKFEEI
jgi:hypothetical protein